MLFIDTEEVYRQSTECFFPLHKLRSWRSSQFSLVQGLAGKITNPANLHCETKKGFKLNESLAYMNILFCFYNAFLYQLV